MRRKACINMFMKGYLRRQISIYNNVSLYKKGTFHHKKGTFGPFKKFRGHVPPVTAPLVPKALGDAFKLRLNTSEINIRQCSERGLILPFLILSKL